MCRTYYRAIGKFAFCFEKTIERYEAGHPHDVNVLNAYAQLFQVPFELLQNMMSVYEIEHSCWKHIDNEMFKYRFYAYNSAEIDENKRYYMVYQKVNNENVVEMGAYTIWKENCCDGEHERRIPRLINSPNRAYWENLYGRVMIVNSYDEICAFYLFGGAALVEKELCEFFLPEFFEKGIIVEKLQIN